MGRAWSSWWWLAAVLFATTRPDCAHGLDCACTTAYSECIDFLTKPSAHKWCPPADGFDRDFCCESFDHCCEVDLVNTVSLAVAVFVVCFVGCVSFCFYAACCPVYLPPLFFVRKYTWCRVTCEESTQCRALGRRGVYAYARHYRHRVALVGTCLALLTIIMLLVCVTSWSDDPRHARRSSWAKGKATQGDDAVRVYYGLGGVTTCVVKLTTIVAVDATNQTALEEQCTHVDWDSRGCRTFAVAGNFTNTFGGCDECAEAGEGVFSLSLVMLAMSSLQLLGTIHRMTAYGDLNVQKFLGIAIAIATMLCSLSCVSTFEEGCRVILPGTFAMTLSDGQVVQEDLGRALGPAMICMIVVVLLAPLQAVAHWLLPTPIERQRKGYRLADTMSLYAPK